MKTTVELADDLLAQARRLAQQEGTTLRSLLEEGLRAVIEKHRQSGQFALRDASVPGDGIAPELRGAPWSRLRDLIYPERP